MFIWQCFEVYNLYGYMAIPPLLSLGLIPTTYNFSLLSCIFRFGNSQGPVMHRERRLLGGPSVAIVRSPKESLLLSFHVPKSL